MGPGTHIASNVLNHVYPVNYNDAVSLIHDIDYLQAKTLRDLEAADTKMIKQLDSTALGLLGTAGITFRRAFGLDLLSKNTDRANRVGDYLKGYIMSNENWVKNLQKYKLNY